MRVRVFPSSQAATFVEPCPADHTREIARSLRDGETRRIERRVSFRDLEGKPTERYFVNESSIGLAPSIIERVKGNPLLNWLPLDSVRGRASFALSALQEIVGLGAIPVRVKIDDGAESMIQTVNLCIANARYFGGGMMIAPDAKLADGLLDVVNVGDINTAKIILNAYTLYRGTQSIWPSKKQPPPIEDTRKSTTAVIIDGTPANFSDLRIRVQR